MAITNATHSNGIQHLIEMIKNNFDGFIENLEIPTARFESEVAYRNKKYDIIFNHDMSYDDYNKNFFFDKLMLQEKYLRRISRLIKKIDMSDILIFVRTSPNFQFCYNSDKSVQYSVNYVNNNPYPIDNEWVDTMRKFHDLYNNKKVITYYIFSREMCDSMISEILQIKNDKKNIIINNINFDS